MPDRHAQWSMRKHLAHLSDEALVALVARGDEIRARRALRPRRTCRVRARLPRPARRPARRGRRAGGVPRRSGARPPPSAPSARRRARGSSPSSIAAAVDVVRREERRRAEPLDDETRDAATTGSAEEAAWLGFERDRLQAALEAAARRPAGGDRARLLRRLLAVRARGEARTAARYDQEQDVCRAGAPARAPRRRNRDGIMETGIHELTAGLRPGRARARASGTPTSCTWPAARRARRSSPRSGR